MNISPTVCYQTPAEYVERVNKRTHATHTAGPESLTIHYSLAHYRQPLFAEQYIKFRMGCTQPAQYWTHSKSS